MKKLLMLLLLVGTYAYSVTLSDIETHVEKQEFEDQVANLIAVLDDIVPILQIEEMFKAIVDNSMTFQKYCQLDDNQKQQIINNVIALLQENDLETVLFADLTIPATIKKCLFLALLKIGNTEGVAYKELIKCLMISAVVTSDSHYFVFSYELFFPDVLFILEIMKEKSVYSLFSVTDTWKIAQVIAAGCLPHVSSLFGVQ